MSPAHASGLVNSEQTSNTPLFMLVIVFGKSIKNINIQLKSGSINQFEVGAYYKKFGLGLIHNSYATNASTSYENADVNHDAYFENGILSDKLKIRFTGIELLYKLPLFKSDFDVTWKLGLGFQAYSINKDVVIQGQYSSHNNYTLKGNILTTMAGVELNYQIWKTIGIGFETSLKPRLEFGAWNLTA